MRKDKMTGYLYIRKDKTLGSPAHEQAPTFGEAFTLDEIQRIESNSVSDHTLDRRRITQRKRKTPPSSAKPLPTVGNNFFNSHPPAQRGIAKGYWDQPLRKGPVRIEHSTLLMRVWDSRRTRLPRRDSHRSCVD
jgi:hypothetical protein